MSRTNSEYAPAIVTHMSYSGIGIVRSLGRRGIPVYALDPNPKQIGMNSRFCKSIVCPSIESDENKHIEFLINFSKTIRKKPVLFPTGDNTVLCYAKHEEILKDYFLFTGPERSIIKRLVTKDAFYKTGLEFNIPMPDTYIPVSLDDVNKIASDISYPCIIKPVRSNSWHQDSIQKILNGSQKVIVARGPDELTSSYKKIAIYDPEVVISEVVPGDDKELYYFVFYMSKNHEMLGYFSGRKMRVYPIHFGSASFVKSVYQEELAKVSINFIENLKYTGLGGIEFKRDQRDKQFKLIEFNARFGLWDVLGVKCGVDTAYIAYCDSIGKKVPKKVEHRTGIKWVSIYLDTKAFMGYKRENLITFRTWIRSLFGEKQWAVFAWDDIMPSLTLTIRFMIRITVRLASRFSMLLNLSKKSHLN